MPKRPGTSKTKNQDPRVLTLHPAGKNGVRIAKDKYDHMRRAILRSVPASAAGITLIELSERVHEAVDHEIFSQKTGILWYLVAVKQDLEARRLIEIIPKSRPQRLRKVRGVRS